MARFLSYLSIVALLFLASCQKETVDGSSVRAFQTSINNLSSELSTLEQTKFNEALYILKTFAVEGDTDLQKLEALAKLIDAKKVPEIFALANEVAQQNGVDWHSTAPPSLGEMNIFQNLDAMEYDANDIKASSLDILVKPVESDSIHMARTLRVIPKLLNNQGEEVVFSNSALETTMEVFSNGERISTSKNIITDNNFRGFSLRLNNISADKVVDSRIDIKVSVKTTQKTHQFLKTGIVINENYLKPVVVAEVEDPAIEEKLSEERSQTEKPEKIVGRFLNSIRNNNLRGAYNVSENPNWESFEQFSDTNMGFGAIKNVKLKNMTTISNNTELAEVNAEYWMEDSDGNITLLNTTYTLKSVDDSWKISNYKINSSEKQ